MPVSIKNIGGKYRVSTPHGIKAKHSTKKNAEAQKRLLNAVEHGWKPTGKKPRKESVHDLATQLLSCVLNESVPVPLGLQICPGCGGDGFVPSPGESRVHELLQVR